MVGGTERVAVAVELVIALAEEVLRVVVTTGVLERDRFVAVDVPHCGILDELSCRSVSQNVIQGAQLTSELVGRLVIVLLGLDDVETAFDQLRDRVFLGVGVEVAHEEGRKLRPLVLLAKVLQQRLRLAGAHVCVVALAVAFISVALHDGALGLEVVDYSHEVRVFVVTDGVELLSQWLARGAGERLVVENDGLADRLHLRRLVNERDADDIFVGTQLLRGLHQRPLVGFLGIERRYEVLQRFVALRYVARHGCGVLDFRQAEHCGVQLVDGGDDLRLLVLEGILGEGAANLAVVRANGLAVDVVVRLAPLLVPAQRAEVVQHVEEADRVVALHGVRHVVRSTAGILPGNGQFLRRVLAGDRLERLETPLVEGVVHHHVGLEVHLVAGADGLHAALGGDDVRQRRVLVGAEVILGAAVVEVHHFRILLRLELGRGSTRGDDVRRCAVRALARRQAKLTIGVERVVVGHRVRPLRAHQHALVRFAGLVASGKGLDLHSLRHLESIVERIHRRHRDLRLCEVLAHLAGHTDGFSALRVVGVRVHVHEDAVGRVARMLLGAGAASLQEETVLPVLLVDGGDDAFGGDRLTHQRRSCAGALDVGDPGDLTRLRRRVLRSRVDRCFARTARILRCRLRD